MKKLFVNMRYLIVPAMSVITILGLLSGGNYVWTGVILFGLACIFLGAHLSNNAVSYTHLRAHET